MQSLSRLIAATMIGDPRGLTAVNDTQKKLFQFGRCALAISGAAEFANSLLDEFN